MLEWTTAGYGARLDVPINLDSEPYRWDHIRFEVQPKALSVVLPDGCPLIKGD